MIEDRECPAALVNAVGGEVIDGLGGVAFLGAIRIEGDEHGRSTFLRHGAIVLVREKSAYAGEEEFAERALRGIGIGQRLFLEEPGEKTLREVLGIVRAFARAPDEGIHR